MADHGRLADFFNSIRHELTQDAAGKRIFDQTCEGG